MEKNKNKGEGVFDDISNYEYHQGKYKDHVGHSGLVQLLKSPAHFIVAKEENKQTPAMELGLAAHIVMLENPEKRICILDYDSKGKSFKTDAEIAKQSGFECVVLKSEWDQLQAMKKALFNHAIAKNLMYQGRPELTGIWLDDMFEGVKCKLRADYWINDGNLTAIIDYKTTTEASLEKFQYTCYDFGYDVQGSWYIRGATKLFSPINPMIHFFLIAQEKEPPYAVNVFKMSNDFIEIGGQKINKALTTYWACIQNPTLFSKAYPDDKFIDLYPPAKAIKQYPK